MKSLMKHLVALTLALVLVLSPMKAFAAELPAEAVYDLEKGGTQTFTIQDEEGEIHHVTIEEVAGNARISNGNYKVTYDNTLFWTAGFYVSVSSNKLTKAYSPFHSVLSGSIQFPVLNLNSNTKATYAFIYKLGAINYSTGVIATMSGTDLIISKK